MVYTALNLNSVDWASLVHAGRQHGNGGNHYVGMLRQRGGGLSGIIASIVRMIPAFFGSTVGREMTNVGQSVINDLQNGSDTVGSSLKRHARESVRRLTGLGRRRRRPREDRQSGNGLGKIPVKKKRAPAVGGINGFGATEKKSSKEAVAVVKPHSLPNLRRGRSFLLR